MSLNFGSCFRIEVVCRARNRLDLEIRESIQLFFLLLLLRFEAQLTHRQEFENAVFHFGQPVVILIEDGRSRDLVEAFVTALRPRKLDDGLQEGSNHLPFHRLTTEAAQATQLAIHFFSSFRRQVQRLEFRSQLSKLVVVIAIAQFILDRLELLAQEDLLLAVTELFLHFGLEIVLSLDDLQLPLHVNQHPTQPLLDGQDFEQLLTLFERNVDITRHQVGQATGILDAAEHLPHRVFPEPGFLAELSCPVAGFTIESQEGRIIDLLRQHVVNLADHGPQIAFRRVVIAHRHATLAAVQQYLDAGQGALYLLDSGNGAQGIKAVQGNISHGLALGHGQNQRVRPLLRRLDGFEGRRSAGADGQSYTREQNKIPERQDRQNQRIII